MRSTFFSCAIAMTRSDSSSFASRITSPVAGSMMSAAGKRAFALGLRQLNRFDAGLLQRLDLVPADLLAGMQRELRCRESGTPAPDRRPTSESATFHRIRPFFITSSSIV